MNHRDLLTALPYREPGTERYPEPATDCSLANSHCSGTEAPARPDQSPHGAVERSRTTTPPISNTLIDSPTPSSVHPSPLSFVDLFAGLGGFHVALSKLGHKCVFASEIDTELRNLYHLNFGILPSADIRTTWEHVPPHDVLCAGFPCQPFSKAGSQLGFTCPDSGDLFQYILKIIDRHKPSFLLFENVPNILKHAGGRTWATIRDHLTTRHYDVSCEVVSPHLFGVPQTRHRAIIVASLHGLSDFEWPVHSPLRRTLSELLDPDPQDAAPLPEQYVAYLHAWQDFLDRLGDDAKLPSFPIWAMEFGATYPYAKRSPVTYSSRYLARFKGSLGESLAGKSKGQQLAALPPYARSDQISFPHWKIRFIRQNREFYHVHERRLNGWLATIKDFPPSFQKLEWNWQAGNRSIWDKVIQFRASGIRVKDPSTAPSLVALTTSQVPAIAWERRYLTPRECARLQSIDTLDFLPLAKRRAFRALGNAVNTEVVYCVASHLLRHAVPRTVAQNPLTSSDHLLAQYA